MKVVSHNAPNLVRLACLIANEMGIDVEIHILPMNRAIFDKNAYVTKSNANLDIYTLFVKEKYLETDKLTPFVIKMFIHELWHVKQMRDGDLTFNENHTIATWKGKKYTYKTPHEQRGYEIEAIKAENKYYRKIKQLL